MDIKYLSIIVISILIIGIAIYLGFMTPEEVDNNKNNKESDMEKNIVETAVSAGQFKTLATALEAAGLIETMSSGGPFTVFAPTDEAFTKLPEGTIESLLEDKDQLTNILKYHVVSGKVMSKDVAGMDSAETLLGKSITIDASNGVMINNAKVIQADIEASNGVIHIIDTVLIPEM